MPHAVRLYVVQAQAACNLGSMKPSRLSWVTQITDRDHGSQEVHHSSLAMRAASLAIGGLAALPFLDPRSFQRHASGPLGVNGRSQQAVAASVMTQKAAQIGECSRPYARLPCLRSGQCDGGAPDYDCSEWLLHAQQRFHVVVQLLRHCV